jgi:predicted transcriptional regulator
MKEEIESRQHKRFLVLNELYKESKGNTSTTIDLLKLAFNVGVKNGIFLEAAGYLLDEKLIGANITGNSYRASITHKGKKAIEYTYKFPDEATEYFPSLNEMIA